MLTDPANCARCEDYAGPMRGLGDAVHAVTKVTGISAAVKAVGGKACGGCAERRAALNAALPLPDTIGEEH